jgi:hypothetical protein
LLTIVLFCALLYPAFRADWLLTRELFHAAESAGILTPGTRFWGQIEGRNIPLHSPAFHYAVRVVSVAVVFAIVLAMCFGAPRLFGLCRGRAETRCGRCGGVLEHLVAPRCPHCGESL